MSHFYLRSERSYVDITTNYANIASIDLDFETEDFLQGDIRLHHLPTLIHEITHHWSLTSFVGTALSAHLLRSHALSATLAAGSELSLKSQQDMERSVVIGKLCQTFFAPIFEGLALYAEWRVTPFSDVVYSRPFAIVRRLAGGSQSLEPDELEELKSLVQRMYEADRNEYQKIVEEFTKSPSGQSISKSSSIRFAMALQSLRAKDYFLERKLSLFEKRINPTDDPYQIGYAFMCGLELSCKGSTNTDKFLAFLKDYFLNDIEMAKLIVEEQEPSSLYSKLRKRLQSRVNDFFAEPDAVLEKLEKWDEDQGFIRDVGGELQDKIGNMEHLHHSCGLSKNTFGEEQAAFRISVDSILSCQLPTFDLSPIDLKNFLFFGRLSMPFRAKKATVTEIDDRYVYLQTPGEARFQIGAKEINGSISVGEEVLILLMFGISSGDVGVCFFSVASNTVILTRSEKEAQEFWERAFQKYPEIVAMSQKGAHALENMRIVFDGSDGGGERIDAGVARLLATEESRKDIEQIYRMPITMAFSDATAAVRDASWREQEFDKWRGCGISSIFDNPRDLIDFARVSMVTMRVDMDISDNPELDISEANVIDAIVKSIYGFSMDHYLETVARLDSTARRKGVNLFSEDVKGFRYPYI